MLDVADVKRRRDVGEGIGCRLSWVRSIVLASENEQRKGEREEGKGGTD
jgi:hypothetical protein